LTVRRVYFILTFMNTATITRKITSKGQITIPKQIRDILHSDFITFEITDKSIYIKPATLSIKQAFGAVQIPAKVKGKTDDEIIEIAKSKRFSNT